MTIKGFVPGYDLKSDMGKQIARLKGLEHGWSYPTFLLYYLRNPGPLCLFDKIIIDKEAAQNVLAYLELKNKKGYESAVIQKAGPTKAEIECLRDLIYSGLFEQQNLVSYISQKDFGDIADGYFQDIGWDSKDGVNNDFNQALEHMTSQYGDKYAIPSPQLFEAMHLNLTRSLSKNLNASPLDDVYRVPLYEYKALQDIAVSPLNVSKAYELVNFSRQVFYLPSAPIRDIDVFIELHSHPSIKSFREKVNELSNSNSTQLEISRELNDAQRELDKLGADYSTLAVALLGTFGGIASAFLNADFITGLVAGTGTIIAYANEWRKTIKAQNYEWLEFAKGISEV